MAPLGLHIENIIGSLLSPIKAHDAKLLTRLPPFTTLAPSLAVTGPSEGTSDSTLEAGHHPALHATYTQIGENRFPSISWKPLEADGTRVPQERITHWLVVVEDPDAPLLAPIVHGIYYDIPREKTSLEHADFAVAADGGEKDEMLSGGFRYRLNRRRTVWSGPRPVMGHGPHRYFFQVIGLDGSAAPWKTARSRKAGGAQCSQEEE